MSDRSTFTAIADPTRRRVLEMLLDRGELRAGEIAAEFDGAARPGISRHLRVLRECGVIAFRSDGRTRTYSLNPKPLAELRDGWLANFGRVHTESLKKLRHRAERPK
ncbi:MAG: ArsR/SmtB family transcription factor [Rhizomicrobium sp.]